MKHFIILRAIDDCDVSVDIEDITSIQKMWSFFVDVE